MSVRVNGVRRNVKNGRKLFAPKWRLTTLLLTLSVPWSISSTCCAMTRMTPPQWRKAIHAEATSHQHSSMTNTVLQRQAVVTIQPSRPLIHREEAVTSEDLEPYQPSQTPGLLCHTRHPCQIPRIHQPNTFCGENHE